MVAGVASFQHFYWVIRLPFVNCRQFVCLVVSLLVLRAGCGGLIVSVPDHCLSFYFAIKFED